jgi:hypothetical protein
MAKTQRRRGATTRHYAAAAPGQATPSAENRQRNDAALLATPPPIARIPLAKTRRNHGVVPAGETQYCPAFCFACMVFNILRGAGCAQLREGGRAIISAQSSCSS